MQMRGLRCAAVRAPCVPCTRGPDPTAKIPSDNPSLTSTTVADTSVATSSRWVHLDISRHAALYEWRSATTRSTAANRGPHAENAAHLTSAQRLALALEEQRTARPLQALSAIE